MALYHGDPSIKLHYASNRAEIPALTTLFPIAPYSKAEADVAREQNVLPAPVLPPAPVPRLRPRLLTTGPICRLWTEKHLLLLLHLHLLPPLLFQRLSHWPRPARRTSSGLRFHGPTNRTCLTLRLERFHAGDKTHSSKQSRICQTKKRIGTVFSTLAPALTAPPDCGAKLTPEATSSTEWLSKTLLPPREHGGVTPSTGEIACPKRSQSIDV